ncbi:MAG: IS66 family insertion sequence element accessory protein TnpB [Thermodesulfobacteriota bacterium]
MIPSHVRIFVCTEPVDMRRSFDGLALAARERLGKDPREGGLFVFANKRSNRLKVLWFDRNGYCLLYKRLHRALFRLPRDGGATSVQIDGAALGTLLAGVDLPARRGAAQRRPGMLQQLRA